MLSLAWKRKEKQCASQKVDEAWDALAAEVPALKQAYDDVAAASTALAEANANSYCGGRKAKKQVRAHEIYQSPACIYN